MAYSDALSKPFIAKNESYSYDYYANFWSFLTFVSLFSYFLNYCLNILSLRRTTKSPLLTFINLLRASCELTGRFADVL